MTLQLQKLAHGNDVKLLFNFKAELSLYLYKTVAKLIKSNILIQE